MGWKPEYEEHRRARFNSDPEYAARLREQWQRNGRTPEENAVYMREYYAANKHKWAAGRVRNREAINTRKREQYASDPAVREYYKSLARTWARNNPKGKKSQRIRQYGLTLEQFHALLKSQDGKCAICGFSDLSKPKLFPVIDHCHDTGRIRGILCSNCNFGIGKFRNDPRLLSAAVAYLAAGEVDSLVQHEL